MSNDNHVKNYVLERHSSREIDRHRVNENDMQIIIRVKGVFVTDGWLFVCWDFARERGDQNCINLNGDSFWWDKTCSFQKFDFKSKAAEFWFGVKFLKFESFLTFKLGNSSSIICATVLSYN